MREKAVELRLKGKLEAKGFLVLKLTTPGYSGTMDRLILRPKYSPGAPYVCEVKRPGEKPRPLQVAVADEWVKRGINVLPFVSTYEEVDAVCEQIFAECCPIMGELA